MSLKPVLYAEDEPDDIVFMQYAFEQAQVSHPLVAVSDGQAAMDYLDGQGRFADRAQHPLPALVLLDLNLPRKTGFEVLRWIRCHPVCHTLPVVMVTSSKRELDVHQSYALGANAYVVKPARLDQLQQTVKTIKDFWLNLNEPPPDMRSLVVSTTGQ